MALNPTTYRQLCDVADTQLGLVTAAQLAELGIRTGLTSRRVAGGMWTRVLPGVHLVDGGEPNRVQREYAAMLYAGSDSKLTGLTSLRHAGVRAVGLQLAEVASLAVEPVHVTIDGERRRLSTGYARIERSSRPVGGLRVPGLPLRLAPVARSVGDAVRRMRHRSDVDALVAEVVRREMCTVEDLQAELDTGQRRGSGLFRDALSGVIAGAVSGPEVDLVRILEQGRVPHVVYNARLLGPDGTFLAIPDAWLDDVGVAIEVDSREHHGDGEGFDRTVRRNARYAAAGVQVVPLLPADVRRRPSEVLKTIQAARHVAMGRPRPSVTVVTGTRPTAQQRGWRYGA